MRRAGVRFNFLDLCLWLLLVVFCRCEGRIEMRARPSLCTGLRSIERIKKVFRSLGQS